MGGEDNHESAHIDPSRKGGFDMLDTFLLLQNPLLPGLGAIAHASQDDTGNLEARFAQANYKRRHRQKTIINDQSPGTNHTAWRPWE